MLPYKRGSELLKAIAHPARMEIIARLKVDGCNVSEIQRNLGLPQSTVSQHLKELYNAGLQIDARFDRHRQWREFAEERVRELQKLDEGEN